MSHDPIPINYNIDQALTMDTVGFIKICSMGLCLNCIAP